MTGRAEGSKVGAGSQVGLGGQSEREGGVHWESRAREGQAELR